MLPAAPVLPELCVDGIEEVSLGIRVVEGLGAQAQLQLIVHHHLQHLNTAAAAAHTDAAAVAAAAA